MNNGGGNIFSLIETGEDMEGIRDYVETPHNVNIRHLADAFGIKYYFCNDSGGLQKQIEIFFGTPGPSLLEIKTDSKVNTRIYKAYFRKLKH
jgi:2-succinyl-5-enolpyruvyl-6-hydroxy-3-cyclohexene-1-carboxylate synthase